MSTRRSPIEGLLSASSNPVLSHPADLIKVGVKGSGLVRWAGEHGIDLPASLYAASRVGDRGVMARVGTNEIILECAPDAPQFAAVERGLRQPGPDVFRVEQQAATFELSGPSARRILAQTCGVNFPDAGPSRIVFTRIAGVSCGVIPRAPGGANGGAEVFRIWVDYTLAPYLWENLVAIAAETK